MATGLCVMLQAMKSYFLNQLHTIIDGPKAFLFVSLKGFGCFRSDICVVKDQYLDKGIPDIQALFHTERRDDTFPTCDQGSGGQTHHHVLRIDLQCTTSNIRKIRKQENQRWAQSSRNGLQLKAASQCASLL